MDFTSSPSVSNLQSIKERMREKLSKSLKAVKLQTSLAAKIKTKTLNNSSILKLSLKHNNKALACALTAEREKSRLLANDKMFLQKEVKMLHFQNALLRQNLSIVNKMLKDIDIFMNINLPAAIELTSTIEPSDCLSLNETRSERFSQQSALSLDGDQGFRLTGMALRVPSNSVEQQKRNSHQTIQMMEESRLIIPPSPTPAAVRESCDKLDELELHALILPSKECNENRGPASLSSVKFSDSILPLDEVFSSSNRNSLGGFVTKRKKRSTVSHSSTASKKSDGNQTRSSAGKSREILPSTHWEMRTDFSVLPDSGHTGLGGTERLYIDSVLQKDSLSTMSHCSSLAQKPDTDQNSDAGKDISKVLCKEQVMKSTNKAELVLNEESDHQTVDGHVGQEETVYEADMEMTSSESASIIAVLPKNKMQASKTKSGIPVKQTGTLRKVKKSVREKTKRTGSSVDQETDNSSNSNERGDKADKSTENLTSDRPDYRRTYVLPGPVVQERLDVLESHSQSDLEVSASRESCIAGQIFPENTIVSNGENSELTFTLEKDCCTERGKTANVAPKKKKSKNISIVESSRKSKRTIHKLSKDQGQLAEENGNLNESTEQMDRSKKINTKPSIHAKNQEPKLRRQTYVISAPEQNPVTHDPISKVHGVNYRRETFVITEPNPLVSVTIKTSVLEERNDKFVDPQHCVKSLVPTDDSPKMENRSDSEEEHCHPTSDAAYGYKKRVPRCSEKKTSSGIFSELDKRKTRILPSKLDDFRGEKGTLVRESFMTLTSSQSDKASKIRDVKTNSNDSIMLDLVSESILDNTMEFSSFAEFPSATNSENTFIIDMSLKSIRDPELPVSEDCDNKETSHVLDHIRVLDENDNGHQKDTHKTEIGNNQQYKVEDQSMEIPETAMKPFQDLTNKSLGSTKQSPKSCSEEEESHGHSRRRRNAVNYKEPNLGKKLRRGDSYTDTPFQSAPIIKGKGKQGGR